MASQPLSPPTNPVPGAIYTEDLTGIAWVWTGVSWIEAGGSGGYNTQVKTGMALTPGFYSALSSTTAGGSGGKNLAQIATQYGPTAPVNPAFGQTWVDTSDANRPVTYVWTDPGAWTKTSDGTNNMYVQAIAPTDHEVGDQWYNTSTSELNIWDGVQWRQVVGTGGGGTAISVQSYATTPSVQSEGSIVYNTTTDTLYISNGSSWLELDQAPDKDTNSILALAAPTARTDGSALQAGDQWVNTSSKTIHYYDGVSSWVRLSSATVGDTHSFWQATAPLTRPDSSVLAEGDIWVDSDNAVASVWTGTVWTAIVPQTDKNTNSIVSPTAPTQRSPGDPTLETGDLWINSNDFSISYYTGLTWIPVTATLSPSSDKHSFSGSAAPIIIQRPDGSPLLAGDQWVNTVTSKLYYWSGSTWVPISAGGDTQSFTGSGSPTLTSRPDATALQDGDMYVDDVTNTIYYYDLSVATWKSTGAVVNDTHSFTGSGAPTLTVRPGGTALQDGDIYVDDVTNTIYYYDLSVATWKSTGAVANDTHSFTGSGAPTLTVRPDGTALKDGDIYIDDVTNTIYYYDLSVATWKSTSAGGTSQDTHSFLGNGAPTLTVRPDTTPLQDGDIYVDEDSNFPYYYVNGLGWKRLIDSAIQSREGLVYGYTSAGAPSIDTYNTFLGWQSPTRSIPPTFTGTQNVSIGNSAASRFLSTASDNTTVGVLAGYRIAAGSGNAVFGFDAGSSIGDTNYATIVGNKACSNRPELTETTVIGYRAMAFDIGADPLSTVAVGSYAGENVDGQNNILLGYQAGRKLTTSGSVIIGTYGLGNLSTNDTLPDGTLVLARGNGTENTLFRINENNAYGIPTSNGSTTVDYGTAGQILTSQGSGAPPIWGSAGAGVDTDTHSILNEGAPTTRDDGSPLQRGDVWHDSSVFSRSAESYFYLNGSWYSTHSVTYRNIGAPTITARDSGEPLVENDLYFDYNASRLYRWTGTEWDIVCTNDYQQATIPLGPTATTGFPTVRSNGRILQLGDILQTVTTFNGGTYLRTYYFDGSAWQPNGTHNFVTDTTPNPAETFAGDTWTAPTNGDFYVAYETAGPTINWMKIV